MVNMMSMARRTRRRSSRQSWFRRRSSTRTQTRVLADGKKKKRSPSDEDGAQPMPKCSHLSASAICLARTTWKRMRFGFEDIELMICRDVYTSRTTSKTMATLDHRVQNPSTTARPDLGKTRANRDLKTNTSRSDCDWLMKLSAGTQLTSHLLTTNPLRSSARCTFRILITPLWTTSDRLLVQADKLNKSWRKSQSAASQFVEMERKTSPKSTTVKSGTTSLCMCSWRRIQMKTWRRVAPWSRPFCTRLKKQRSSSSLSTTTCRCARFGAKAAGSRATSSTSAPRSLCPTRQPCSAQFAKVRAILLQIALRKIGRKTWIKMGRLVSMDSWRTGETIKRIRWR